MDVDQPVNDVGSGTSSIHWPSNTPSRSLRVSGLKRQPLSGLIPWNTTDLMHFTRNVWKCQKVVLIKQKIRKHSYHPMIAPWINRVDLKITAADLSSSVTPLPGKNCRLWVLWFPLGCRFCWISRVPRNRHPNSANSVFHCYGCYGLYGPGFFRSDLWFSDRKMPQIWLSWLFQRSVTGSRSRSQCVQPLGTLVFGTTKLNHSSKLASFKSYANKQLVLFLLVLFTMDLYDAIWQESLRNTSKISPHIIPSYNHIPIYPLYIHYIPIIYIYLLYSQYIAIK